MLQVLQRKSRFCWSLLELCCPPESEMWCYLLKDVILDCDYQHRRWSVMKMKDLSYLAKRLYSWQKDLNLLCGLAPGTLALAFLILSASSSLSFLAVAFFCLLDPPMLTSFDQADDGQQLCVQEVQI